MYLSHLLRTDVRHFKWLLAGWVLVQAMSAVYRGMAPFVTDDRRAAALVAVLGFVLTLARWLGLAAMVPLLLQTHPATGSDAFWLTRPIPWRSLLLSKMVLIGALFVVMPGMFEAILMAVFRVPLRDILVISAQGMVLLAVVVALLMALAALTRNLARFALVAGGLLLVLGMLANVGLIVAMRMIPSGPEIHEVGPRVAGGSSLGEAIPLIGLMAALAALIAVQYRSRSTPAAVSTGVLGIVLAVAVLFLWPSSDHVLAAPSWADRNAAPTVVVHAPKIEFTRLEQWLPSEMPIEWATGAVHVRLAGMERSWLGSLRLAESHVQFEDGARLTTAGNGYGNTASVVGGYDLPDDRATRDVLDVSRLWPIRVDPREVVSQVPAIVLREADFRQRLGGAATYHGRFIVDLDQLQVAGILPLQPGAEFQDKGYRITIEGAMVRGARAQVRVRWIATDPGAYRSVQSYLRNQRTSEAIRGYAPANDMQSFGFGMLALAGVSAVSSESAGFDVRREMIEFSGFGQSSQDGLEITADWLAQAELVVVSRVSAGSVSRTIDIPRAEIVESPRRTTTR